MIQKIIVILIATLIMLIRTVGKEKINRKMMIFLSSVVVLSSILMIFKQITNQEIVFFSFFEISGLSNSSEFNFAFTALKFVFETVLSLIILSRIKGEAKFKQDFWIFITAIIATQIIFVDYPKFAAQIMPQTFFAELIFAFLYLFILTAFCKNSKKQSAE